MRFSGSGQRFFLAVAALASLAYFLFFCYLTYRVFRNINLKRSALPSMSEPRRQFYQVISDIRIFILIFSAYFHFGNLLTSRIGPDFPLQIPHGLHGCVRGRHRHLVYRRTGNKRVFFLASGLKTRTEKNIANSTWRAIGSGPTTRRISSTHRAS